MFKEICPFSFDEIRKAAQALSERYRSGVKPFLRTSQDRWAYLYTRFPATKAALQRIFREIQTFSIQSLLDIGAGPGTSWFAAKEFWPDLEATFVEKDPVFTEIGSQLIPEGKWRRDFSEKHDLVVFSYSWGEIDNLEILGKAWELTGEFLVVVEPGTSRGYEKMLKARDYCIAEGGEVYAPCPHSRRCPWEGTEEWCHFGVRLERSEEHRLAKEGALGYEDEKFSYVIVSKNKKALTEARVLRDPMKRKGHLQLVVCTRKGIETQIVSKKDGDVYKKGKRLKWGDVLR